MSNLHDSEDNSQARPRFQGFDQRVPEHHINPKDDQIVVGYYFAESKLKDYEEAIVARHAWVGWFGALTSCLAAAYATKDSDLLWVKGWYLAVGITGIMLLLNLVKWALHATYTRERFLMDLKGQIQTPPWWKKLFQLVMPKKASTGL